MSLSEHWNQIYQTKASDDVSWYQIKPTISLKLIEATGVGRGKGIIDVGGGASVLVDFLLDAGFTKLAVLDIAATALQRSKQRLSAKVGSVEWFEADVTAFNSPHLFDLWHDRAVFHFLTHRADRQKYVQTLKRTQTHDGYVIVGTFAIDGPLKCSGLEVARYDAPGICAELGDELRLIEQLNETHVTPWNTEQKFSFFHFARNAGAPP